MNENKQIKILVIEKDPSVAQLASLWEPVHLGWEVFQATSIQKAVTLILEKPVDIILSEFELKDGTALALLDALACLTPRMLPVVILAEEEQDNMAVELFRKGARDYIIKDKNNVYAKRLPLTLDRIMNEEERYLKNSRLVKNNEAILSTISDGVLGINLSGYITFANPAAAIYINQSFDALVGKKIDSFTDNIDVSFFQNLQQAMHHVQMSNKVMVIGQYLLHLSANSQLSTVETSLTPIFNELLHLEGYVLSLRDISFNKELNDELRQKSIRDDLTGLYNRKTFISHVEHVMSYCEKHKTVCAVLYIDLDGFKLMNDALGHEDGNKILLRVTDKIQSLIKSSDILARSGNDEFLVLLRNIQHVNDAAILAQEINHSIQEAMALNNQHYYLTASIGIAVCPHDSSDAAQLVQQADFAMSMVKKSGKNNYQYYQPELNIQAQKTMKLSHDLRSAIKLQQLELYFHPLICAYNDAVVGFEALLRWHHPELGMISPGEFIPIAEEIGFINQIGKWVWEQVCETHLLWKENGWMDVTLSVNISVAELQQEDFIDQVRNCLDYYLVDPAKLQVEITESIFAQDISMIIKKLVQLKSMGFQIAMDDFGTGYSCLSYLKDLPIDVIKIDRSFVHSLNSMNNERHKAIINVIIELAKRLNITTLAEGVENEKQAQYLKKLGCEFLQGFLYAQPMPFDEATVYMHTKRQHLMSTHRTIYDKKLH